MHDQRNKKTTVLAFGCVLVLSFVLAACADGSAGADAREPVGPPASTKRRDPTLAVSLTMLQEQARHNSPNPTAEVARLGGMTRISGIIIEPDGEIILLGDRDSSWPALSLDDLAVAVRNAYGRATGNSPGCTIDPWWESKDPWRIHEVKVFGMAVTERAKLIVPEMGKRFVDIDYELKSASGGLLNIDDRVPSVFGLEWGVSCGTNGTTGDVKVERTHRFWFTPLYPAAPRFQDCRGVTLIDKPVEVQLLTEREFLGKRGERSGSAPASPAATEFARSITELLNSRERPEYVRLVSDFRMIELAMLLRFKEVPENALGYLLDEHEITQVTINRFVGGIRRRQTAEIVCGVEITGREVSDGIHIESREEIRKQQLTYRGGVEAAVAISDRQFKCSEDATLGDLQRRVQSGRPSTGAMTWFLRASSD